MSTFQTQPATALVADAARIAVLEAALAAEQLAHASSRAQLDELTKEHDHLQASYERLRQDLELLRRRIFIAKAERVDSAQLELEFAKKLAALDVLAGRLADEPTSQSDGTETTAGDTSGSGKRDTKKKPAGRRDLSKADIPEVRVEITDPVFDALVLIGKAELIDWEESYKIAWQRGGHRRLVIARAKYRTVIAPTEAAVTAPTEVAVTPAEAAAAPAKTVVIVTAPMPAETFARSLAAPSLLSYIITEKHCQGLPLYRLEDRFARDGTPIDRGTMCRWLEDAGATAGATVIQASRDEAFRTAFCLSTDATGVAIQPIATGDKKRQPCRRGHFFVQIADWDYVFFEFTARETSAKVREMFRGFSGYVQADAKSVFNVLYRASDEDTPSADGTVLEVDGGCREVGCLAHARRKFWEAAVSIKSASAREALFRIKRIYDFEELWRSKSPEEIKSLRNLHARPLLDSFFTWAAVEYEKVRGERGLLRTAFGYSIRHKEALLRFLDDGRLKPDNNRSERELRRIAVGRKAWLFVGSDDHAVSAGHLFSLIASARLHRLDPEAYLRDLFRVLGHWPRDRYLELAPKFWAATRSRLDPAQLVNEIGPLTVPAPINTTASEQQSTSG
jgi:transposase